MGSGLISIAVTGINAAQLALSTTSNNITNASTEGYSRQRVVQASNSSVMTGSGAVGQGTHVVTIERLYSQALNTQVLNAQTKVSALDSYYAQASQIDNLLANSDSGISTSIQDFFDSIQSVASDPSSQSARQTLVSSAESLVSTFKSLYTSLNELESGVNTQITSDVSSINSYAEQIADLNKQIAKTQGASGQSANDLLDQRDLLVSKLNKLVNVSVSTADDGSYNVFFGNGQQLVVGTTASTLSAVPSAADPSRTVVGIDTGSGTVQELPESLITGGDLGGLISFRSEVLDNSYNQLGTLAASVAETYNAQSALGQDLLGNVAGDTDFVADFFTLSEPTVIANDNNTGTATVTATLDAASSNGTNFYTNLKASDYKLSYDGSTYTLTRLSDNTAWTGASISDINAQTGDGGTDPQGFSLATSSALTSGDSYVIQPTRDLIRGFSVDATVSSDPSLIAAASPIAMSGATANTGTVSISGLSVSAGYSISGLETTDLALTYDSATTSLSGFPDGEVVVTSGSTSTTYNVPTDTVPYTSGATITINSSDGTVSGLSFVLSGLPDDGDTFTLSPNTGGTGDASNIVLLGNLQTQNTMSGGTASYEDDYAAYVNDVGNKTSSASTSSGTMTTILETATDAQAAVSGVNTDEEAAKLIEYQQAYQASAKILEVASKIFDTLLAIS
jgi:flagellar hook-associated protein 1